MPRTVSSCYYCKQIRTTFPSGEHMFCAEHIASPGRHIEPTRRQIARRFNYPPIGVKWRGALTQKSG